MLVPRFGQKEARERAVQVALQVLDGKLSMIMGARELNGLLRDAGLPDDDPDLMDCILIDSETDTLPIALPLRARYDETALANKESDVRRAEAWASEFGHETCRRIIARLASANEEL